MFSLMLFAAMLLASLLVAAAVGIRTFLKRGQVSRPAASQPAAPSGRARLADLFLLVAVAATWYNVSSGWVAEFTIYPIYADMNQFGPQVFHGFSKAYLSRLPVIILPAGVMFLAWSLLLWVPAQGVSLKSIWLAVALCTAFVAITPMPAGAQARCPTRASAWPSTTASSGPMECAPYSLRLSACWRYT